MVHRRPFTVEELTGLFEAAREDAFLHPLAVAAACTGLRRGDVCRLTWGLDYGPNGGGQDFKDGGERGDPDLQTFAGCAGGGAGGTARYCGRRGRQLRRWSKRTGRVDAVLGEAALVVSDGEHEDAVAARQYQRGAAETERRSMTSVRRWRGNWRAYGANGC